MIRLLDRYIASRILVATALVLGVLTSLTVFFAFLDALKDYGQANFDLYQVVRYVVLLQPRKLYEVFPVITLIGTLLGLSTLAVNAELVAMRAAGVSILQIVGAAMRVGFVLAIAVSVLGEYFVPAVENEAQVGRAKALARGVALQKTGLWLRDGQDFVNIGEVMPDLSLQRVNVYSFENQIRLRVHARAERALLTPEGWQLQNVLRSEIGDHGIVQQHLDRQAWTTTLTREVVGVFAVQPEQLSMQQLTHYIEHLSRNSQSTERYRLVLWQKLLMPLAVVVMVLIATPFALGQTRGGTLSRRVFAGIMLGLLFVVVTRSFGHFGLLYGVAPMLGALLPILLFLFGALVLLRRSV